MCLWFNPNLMLKVNSKARTVLTISQQTQNITTTPISTLVTFTVKIQSVEEKQPTVYTAKMSIHTTNPPCGPHRMLS